MTSPADRPVYKLGDWVIDLGRRELLLSQIHVPIGGRAFEILEILVRSAGELVAKEDIFARIWPGAAVEDNTLQVHISAIRKALGADRDILTTVSGRGYRLLGNWQYHSTIPQANDADPSPLPIAPVRSNLPLPGSALIGRAEAVREIEELLSAYRLVTATGPGGIGKTRLAQAVARELLPMFNGDVQLVELAAVSDVVLVPAAIAGIPGLQLGGTTISPEVVARAIGDRRVLIVLDNCEHIIDAVARCVETILRHCRYTSVLATSRELLRIDGEFAYRVGSLEVPSAELQAPDQVLRHSGVALFLERVRAVTSDFIVNNENLFATAAICRRLDGIPLAIELAAGRVATLGIGQVVARLDDRFGLLSVGRRTALPRHQTLRATLDWSYDLLPIVERVILCRLGVFNGGFTVKAACAVAATGEISDITVIDGIVSLVSKSLVAVEMNAQEPRHFLLETVRAYALERLIEAGELKAVRRRHAQYYQLMFETADAERRGMAINEWLAVYGREIDNVRAAIDWGFSDEGDAAIAATLSADSTGLMYDLSLVGECRRRAEQALLAIKAGVQISPRSEMQLLASLQASRVYTDGPSPEGVAAWERVLAIATQLGEDDYQCRSLWGLWNDNIYSGSPERALIFAKQLADHPTSQSSPAGVTTAELLGSRTIGIALHYCGDQIAAARHLEFVLSHYVLRDHRWKTLGSRLDHATVTRATLARILWLRGYPEQARQMTDLALQQAIADDHSMSILYILVEAAIPLSLFSGELKRARSFVATLLEQAPRTGFRNWQATGRAFTALLLTSESDRRADLTALSDAVRELDDIGYCAHLTMYLGALARVQASSGRSSDADETVDRALARSAAHAEHWFRAELLRIKSDIAVQRGDDETAISLLHQALDLAREQGARSWELRAATSLARLLLRQGRAGEVRTILAPVFAWFTEGFETADLCAASACLAEIEAPGTR